MALAAHQAGSFVLRSALSLPAKSAASRSPACSLQEAGALSKRAAAHLGDRVGLGARGLGASQAQFVHTRRSRATPSGASRGKVVAMVVPAVIVGGGRIGRALADLGDGRDIIVGRSDKIPEEGDGPIIVCTRNDVLDSVVERTPVQRRKDLVFVQNGMLEPWLKEKGLASATQVLIYFGVAKLGEKPTDGKTDVNPEGLTAAYGKWAPDIAARLHAGGLACHLPNEMVFRASMFEKLIWICAFNLVGGKHGANAGQVEAQHKDEVVGLIQEMVAASRTYSGAQFAPGVEDRMLAYARSVAHFPMAVKEFQWRNGYYYGITQKALEQKKADPLPLHTAALKAVKAI